MPTAAVALRAAIHDALVANGTLTTLRETRMSSTIGPSPAMNSSTPACTVPVACRAASAAAT